MAFPFPGHAANVKISGTIQAEIASSEESNSGDRVTLTHDLFGTTNANGGPSHIKFDFTENLGNGLDAFGRIDMGFSTAHAAGLIDRETVVGIKTANSHIRIGFMFGAYKRSLGLDPFAGTAMQARGVGGGMTGNKYRTAEGPKKNTRGEYGHSYAVDNVIEYGFQSGGFSIHLQGVFDESADMDSGGLFQLKYATQTWSVFTAGSYVDFKEETDKKRNLKIGGTYKTGGLTLGAQYENVDLGTFDNSDGADYIFVSADYRAGNYSLCSWIAGYSSDVEKEDALSFAIGAKYHFSKRTLAYIGYRDTDSDNDVRDENTFALGLKHNF